MKTLSDDFGLSPLPVLTRDTAPNPARMRRETLLLDGLWNLSVNGGAIEPVQVPFAPQAKVNGIRVPDGDATLRYATTFELPADWPGAMLHLEGVDHEAEVLVNGVPLARHVGAWDPIGVFVPRDVLAQGLRAEHITLHKVEVVARDNSRARTILSGKQERQATEGVIFYGNMSGIWKSVWVERVSHPRLPRRGRGLGPALRHRRGRGRPGRPRGRPDARARGRQLHLAPGRGRRWPGHADRPGR
jgi:hypothetical protein